MGNGGGRVSSSAIHNKRPTSQSVCFTMRLKQSQSKLFNYLATDQEYTCPCLE